MRRGFLEQSEGADGDGYGHDGSGGAHTHSYTRYPFTHSLPPKGVRAGVDPATTALWNAGHEQMMRDTTAALGNGLLVGKNFPQVMRRAR